MKYTLLFLLLSLSFQSFGNTGYFKIFDEDMMQKASTMKVVKFDTVNGWVNYYNQKSQMEFKYRILQNLRFGINESSSYEILTDDSKVKPDLNLHFSISHLYAITTEMPDTLKTGKKRDFKSTELECEIKLTGYSSVDNSKVFETSYYDYSTELDEDDEITVTLLDLVNDIDNVFDSLSNTKRLRTYQKYDFSCKMVDTINYYIIADQSFEPARKICSILDAEVNQNAVSADVNIFKIYNDSTTDIFKNEMFDLKESTDILKPKMQDYLLNKGIKSLLLFTNLTCRLPHLEGGSFDFYSVPIITFNSFGGFGVNFMGSSEGSGSGRVNNISEAEGDMLLIDVVNNKRLISTRIYGNDGREFAEKALSAIGILNLKDGTVKQCYDFDF